MASGVKENLASPNRRKGRPSWRLPDLGIIEDLARSGVTLDQMAVSLGIDRATLFRKKREREEFCDAIKRGRAKGLLAVYNALYERVKANNVNATIRLLKRLGWNKRDSRSCPDPSYVAKIKRRKWRIRFRLLSRFMTAEEWNRYIEMRVQVAERKKAAGPRGQTEIGGGREKVRYDTGQRPQEVKPASPRTGRPPWSPPEPEVVQGLAERGLTLDQIAVCLEVNRSTLYRRIRSDEDFAQAIATGTARAMAFASGKLFQQALNGKVRALIFYLRTVHGWGENRPEHVHGWECEPPEDSERSMAEVRLLTYEEVNDYCNMLRAAQARMEAAGVDVPDDGLDEWGNLKKPR
jgi:hypothetical protein